MKCFMCKHGETQRGKTTQMLQRGESLVVKEVQTNIFAQCGENYLDEAIAQQWLEMTEEAVRHGAEIEIRRFAA